jgi:hypothetical protein
MAERKGEFELVQGAPQQGAHTALSDSDKLVGNVLRGDCDELACLAMVTLALPQARAHTAHSGSLKHMLMRQKAMSFSSHRSAKRVHKVCGA